MSDRHTGQERAALEEAHEATEKALDAAETAEERVAAAQEGHADQERTEDDAGSSPELDEFSTSWGAGAPDVGRIDMGGGGGSPGGGTTGD